MPTAGVMLLSSRLGRRRSGKSARSPLPEAAAPIEAVAQQVDLATLSLWAVLSEASIVC
jgi:hypothetical protein